MKAIAPLLAATLFAGCATLSNPVPDDFQGPTVKLSDTGSQESGSKGRFFAALEVDGKPIENSILLTRVASHGRGMALTSRYASRDVPVRPMKVKLTATHQTAAPIHEIAGRMAGTFFRVEGTVDFAPTAGRRYEVTGELAKERSCAWISDAESGQPATDKVCDR